MIDDGQIVGIINKQVKDVQVLMSGSQGCKYNFSWAEFERISL